MTSTNNATAMSLWQRFTEMQAAIDESRNQREALTEETHCIQQAVSGLQDCVLKDQAARNQAKRDYDALTTELATWQARLAQAQTQHAQASREKQHVQQQTDRWKQTQMEQREDFLEQSRLFRSKCKKMRLTASALALPHAGSAAYAAVRNGPEAAWVYHGIDDDSDADESGQSERGNGSVEERENDPSTWRVASDDHEMKDRLATYLETKNKVYEAARKALEDQKRQKLALAEKCTSREEHEQKLKAQIDRLGKDNQDLETEIRELAHLTEEANLMADGFEKKLKQSSTPTMYSSTVTPSPVPRNASNRVMNEHQRATNNHSHMRAHNPYAKSSHPSAGTAAHTNGRVSTGIPASLVNDPRHDQIRAIALGQQQRQQPTASHGLASSSPDMASPLELQHPHRATGRRFRRDKQFGCSLQVRGGQDHRHVRQDAVDDSLLLQVDAASSVTTPVAAHHASRDDEQVQDDDDDDDDALLSYVAFQK